MQTSGIITLLTDFGERDGFVGTMKGVILSINPNANIVDISHGVEPQNIDAGAFLLRNSYRYFPKGTIHVVVIDPGVGSTRRAIGVSADGHLFLAPDNGVLKYIFHQNQPAKVVELSNEKYFLKQISRTFHGRDIFAPAAAHLSLGVSLMALGEVITDYYRGEVKEPIIEEDSIQGQVIYIDRFGNLITNISEDLLRGAIFKRLFHISIGNFKINRISRSYSVGSPDEPIALVGSSGCLEISINQRSARKVLGMREGDVIKICLK